MKIACLIPGGLGGTQKAGWLFAAGLARLGHEVAGISPAGPFVPANPPPGLVVESIGEKETFSAIADGKFDALHVHMPGYYNRDPLYPLLKSLGQARPRVVETNVFGWLQDWRANPVTDFRLFISMTSAWQAAKGGGTSVPALRNCSVARYPVEPARVFSVEERSRTRRELGFGEDDVVALRLGRPDAAKWTDQECACAVEASRQGAKKLKLLAIEPPPELRQRIARGEFGESVTVRDIEANPARVAALVDACDLVFHAARFGESFGYAIAEGMAAGKPVITRTTPWGDNAQVELVEHGATGFVCCSSEGLTSALKLLAEEADLRRTLGDAGRERILRLADPARECSVLDAAITGDTALLQRRREEMLDFTRNLPDREWNVLEQNQPELLQRERQYSSRYQLKKRLSALRADLRSLLGKTAYL